MFFNGHTLEMYYPFKSGFVSRASDKELLKPDAQTLDLHAKNYM